VLHEVIMHVTQEQHPGVSVHVRFKIDLPNRNGEHTRPGCGWTRPRVQRFGARYFTETSGKFAAPDVFREGAENGTRGARAPPAASA